MITDLVKQFQHAVTQSPQIVLDNYSLKEGIYICIDLNRSWEENISTFSERYVIVRKGDKENVGNYDLLKWFRIRDYYSSVLNDDMNKALDLPARKIHSNNGIALFMKDNVFFGLDDKLPLESLSGHLMKFYDVDLSKTEERLISLYPIRGKKAEKERQLQERDMFFQKRHGDLLQYLHSDERKKLYEDAKHFWHNHALDFVLFLKELQQTQPFSNYIKIFFDLDENTYRKEFLLYILPKIYNVNDYNEVTEEGVIGLPAYGISMNSKKPFLELKTMKTKVPLRMPLAEALVMKDMYKWLESQGKFKEFQLHLQEPFDFADDKRTGRYHLRLDSNGNIEYYEQVPFTTREEFRLDIRNAMRIEEVKEAKRILKTYEPITSYQQLHGAISRSFFAGKMGGSFLHSDPPKVNPNEFTSQMQNIFIISRQALYDFLYKGTNITIIPFVEQMTQILVEEQLSKCVKGLSLQMAAEAMNLRLALLNYFQVEGGSDMGDRIEATYKILREKIDSSDLTTCTNDEEFYFMAGQLAYYLFSQSQASNKHYGMFEPILQAKNDDQLKNRLYDVFNTYSHAIGMNAKRFRNGLSMVMGYEAEGAIKGMKRDMLLAGILSKNMFYEKKEGDK